MVCFLVYRLLGPIIFKNFSLARSKNQGPFSGRRSSPQNGWTHYGSTRFAGCILVRKVVAVFWVHWQSVINFFKVMVFLPLGVGIRCMLVRFGSRSDSCGPFCSMPFGDLRAIPPSSLFLLETFMVFWIHLHASAAGQESPGQPF